jgi:hypothetical protein
MQVPTCVAVDAPHTFMLEKQLILICIIAFVVVLLYDIVEDNNTCFIRSVERRYNAEGQREEENGKEKQK